MPPPPRSRAALLALTLLALALRADGDRTPRLTFDPSPAPTRPAAPRWGALTVTGELEGSVLLWIEGPEGEEQQRRSGPLPQDLAGLPLHVPLTLRVEAAGQARIVETFTLEAAATTYPIAFEPGGRLEARLQDEEDGPVAGGRVLVEVDGERWEGTSDADGRVAFDTLPAEAPVRVTASAAGHGTFDRAALPLSSTQVWRLPRVGRIVGRVLDLDGGGAGEAEVRLVGSGVWPARVVPTDAEGRFVLEEVPPGVYEVGARRAERVARPRQGLLVEPSGRYVLTLPLEAGVTVAGRVVDADTGAGVAGAEIQVADGFSPLGGVRAESDAEGRFTLTGLLDPPTHLRARHPAYVAARVAVGEDAPRVALERGATLVGVVLDRDGRPVAGARLEVAGEREADGQPLHLSPVMAAASAMGASGAGALPVVAGPVPPIAAAAGSVQTPEAPAPSPFFTGRDGRFEIPGVPPGRVEVRARAEGYAPAVTDRVFVTSAQRREGLSLTLCPSGEVRGRVLDTDGRGVPRVLVHARYEGAPYPATSITDEEGAFRLPDLAGTIVLTARPRRGPTATRRLTVGAGETRDDVELVLGADRGALSGRLTDRRGFPIAPGRIQLSALRAGASFQTRVEVEPDGTFALQSLPAGPWLLEAEATGYARGRWELDGDEGEHEARLARAGQLGGRLLDASSGEPIADAEVALEREAFPPEVRQERSALDGRFSFDDLDLGRWRLAVRDRAHLSLQRPVEVGDETDLGDLYLEPGGRAEGIVVDALGSPVPYARVRSGGIRARAGRDGVFALGPLPAGRLQLEAWHPAAGASEVEVVRILAGRETPNLVLHLEGRFRPEEAPPEAPALEGVPLSVAGDPPRITEDSAFLGLRRGDRLLAVDGRRTPTAEAAERALRGPRAVRALLRVERRGVRATIWAPRTSWRHPESW